MRKKRKSAKPKFRKRRRRKILRGEKLAAFQYEQAKQYPKEYTVFVKSHLYAHTPDRKEGFKAYQRAFDETKVRPVIIPPEPEQNPSPPGILRARL